MTKTRAMARSERPLSVPKNNLVEKKKRINKIQINSNDAKLQSGDLNKIKAKQASLSELMKFCRPVKVRLTRCVEISNYEGEYGPI